MLNWIAGFVDRWTPVVSTAIRDLVHWAIHALAGVVYTVFGHVGAAWREVYDSLTWHLRWAVAFVHSVVSHLDTIITKDIPFLWKYFLAQVVHIGHLIVAALNQALAFADSLYHKAVNAIDALNRWVNTHVLLPLSALIAGLRRDLLKWGFFAYQLLNDPGKLAAILARFIVAAILAIFWTVAGPVGEFIAGIILKQLPRFVKLVETILAAVI